MNPIEFVYQNYVTRRFAPPSESDVAALERRINVRFPPEYRRFLMNYNGGWFSDHELELPEDVPEDRVECLYGIGADHETAELGRRSDMLLFDNNDPPLVVIIGRTPINQLIVLGVGPENYGEIFFKTYWSRVSKSAVEWFFLADSIDEFFLLISEPFEDE